MKVEKNKKIILICAILLVCTLPVFFAPLDKKCGYIYTHIFFIPVILASYWFYFHALWAVVFLSLVMTLSLLFTGISFHFPMIFFVTVMLAITVLLIVYLKRNNESGKSECIDGQNRSYREKGSEGLITEKNRAEISDEMEQVLQEVYHRVKNNMQIITSLISLQIVKERDKAVKSALIECQNRVKAMSIIHEKLYTSERNNFIEMRGYVETLAPYLLRAYNIDKEKIRVIIDIEPLFLDLKTAIPLSQMINEIMSNSFKHAFVLKEHGEVVIKLSCIDKENGFYSLSISDNGSGFPQDVLFPDKGKLGFHLISGLARQMGGTLKQGVPPGTSFYFTFREK